MGGADAGLGDIRQTVGFASVAPGSPVDVVVVVVFSVGLAWTSSHLHTDVAYRRVSDVVAWRLGDAVLFRAMVPSFSTGFFVVFLGFFFGSSRRGCFQGERRELFFFCFFVFLFFFRAHVVVVVVSVAFLFKSTSTLQRLARNGVLFFFFLASFCALSGYRVSRATYPVRYLSSFELLSRGRGGGRKSKATQFHTPLIRIIRYWPF